MTASPNPSRRAVLKGGLALGVGLSMSHLPGTGIKHALATAPSELITKPIPSSGERIPVIGIGTARRYDVDGSAAARVPLREVLRTFPELGGRLVDTAPSYGRAEPVVGDLVAAIGNRDKLFLATKVRISSGDVKAGIAEMEQSLRHLHTDRIDLMQVHNLAGVDELLPVLREWKQAGRIRYVGITTSFERQYEDFVRVMAHETLDFIQVDYAIDNRSAADRILPLAADRGMAVLTNLPFGRGRVFQAFRDKPVPEWAREWDIESWAQFALKYVVSHPAVTCAIPGTATLAYLQDNMGAARGRLPDAGTRSRMAALIDSA
ncbi:MAG TPA: aldo/keto reductase [Rhodocyclaceae bacterium]|nr:aldo/keto reductase [Rhodocyclaceae bacterium]HRQ47093.1 aldo/keto reductase [Rhodocyclaceae bacterium]